MSSEFHAPNAHPSGGPRPNLGYLFVELIARSRFLTPPGLPIVLPVVSSAVFLSVRPSLIAVGSSARNL